MDEYVRSKYQKFCKLDENGNCAEESLRSPIDVIGDENMKEDSQLKDRIDSIMKMELNEPGRDLFPHINDTTMMRTVLQLGGPLDKKDFDEPGP